MTDFTTNYNQILEDVVAMITQVVGVEKDNPEKFTRVAKNLDPTDFHTASMPLCDVRLSAARPANTAGQTYYNAINVELEIAAFDLSQQDKAATIMLNLLPKVQRAFVQNPHWGAVWDSIVLGDVVFLFGQDRDPAGGAFVASAVAQVTINVYTDA
jgi:hypothetical protein